MPQTQKKQDMGTGDVKKLLLQLHQLQKII